MELAKLKLDWSTWQYKWDYTNG